MIFNKIRLSRDVSSRLQQLKVRTGLTPNILTRIALCYSLNDPVVPNPKDYDEEGQEFNRYTMTGDYDRLFVAMVMERCKSDGLDPEKDFLPQFRAHANRGVNAMYVRVRSLSDIRLLLPKEYNS